MLTWHEEPPPGASSDGWRGSVVGRRERTLRNGAIVGVYLIALGILELLRGVARSA